MNFGILLCSIEKRGYQLVQIYPNVGEEASENKTEIPYRFPIREEIFQKKAFISVEGQRIVQMGMRIISRIMNSIIMDLH